MCPSFLFPKFSFDKVWSLYAVSHVHVLILQEAFVTSEEFGEDLEHVEVLQKKFDEFQKVIFGVQI